ncbi:MAG: hypothetical protein M1819_000755 [Sarea resinae]|nr:MAG: hypothetical protein M1819_000755 [Sarea resinae]
METTQCLGEKGSIDERPVHRSKLDLQDLDEKTNSGSEECPTVQRPRAIAVPHIPSKNCALSEGSVSSMPEIDLEKAIPQQGLPETHGPAWWRYIRHTFFPVYRRLFSIVFVANMTALVVMLARHTGISSETLSQIATITTANLLVAILMRQEHVINLLFLICCAVPRCAPLFIRRRAAKVYHLGGLHSGCAVAATFWFLVFAVLLTQDFILATTPEIRSDPSILIITYALLSLLIAISISAHPRIRAVAHNSFERIHRFAGWTALILFWTHAIILSNTLRKTYHSHPTKTLVAFFLTTPSFYFLTAITLSIVYPWVVLVKVPITTTRPSSHVIRLHFNHASVPLFTGIRISDSPLKEWHAFATIPEPPASDPPLPLPNNAVTTVTKKTQPRGFSCVVSNAGDWTNRIISSPPSHIYIRGAPTRNLLHATRLFKRVVIVATGSGIGPCLALRYSPRNKSKTRITDNDHDSTKRAAQQQNFCRILWSTASPLQTYGQGILDEIHALDKDAVIVDTRAGHNGKAGGAESEKKAKSNPARSPASQRWRPNMVQLAWNLYRSCDAEAVFVISNPKVTALVVEGLEGRGIPAYGALFDS